MSQPVPTTQQHQDAASVGYAQEVDAADEQDHDAVEAALAAALAAQFIGWLTPGWPSFFGNRQANRQAQLEAAIGQTLLNYIARTAHDLGDAVGGSGGASAASAAVDAVYPRVLRIAERWADETYRTMYDFARSHGLADTAQGARTPDDARGQASQLAKDAGERAARALVTYATSETRNDTAGRLGALWSIWASRRDNRVRDTHRHLNGLQVPFGGRFVSESGALLRFPGDPEAPLSETLGCRCRLKYRFRPKGTSYADV